MRHFGEFLVHKGILSTEQLAQVLIEQLQSTPSSIAVLSENGCLGTQAVLDILSLQSQERLDFRSACINLNLWDDIFEEKLQAEIYRARPKLGQLVINKGWVDPQKLLCELKEFQSYCTDNQLTNELQTPPAIEAAAITHNGDSEQTALVNSSPREGETEYHPEFGDIEMDSILDYLDLFSEEKKSTLESIILSVETLMEGNVLAANAFEVLDMFFGDYHSLKGAARSVGAVLTENLIHESEDLLTFFKQFAEKVANQDYINLSEINLSVLDLLCELKSELAGFGTEEGFWGETSARSRYLVLLARLHKMLGELQSRNYQITLDDVGDLF